jgi:hypothetical protein
VVTSWNEYCTSDMVGGFLGLGFSTDSGETWVNSLTPGYPEDTSTEGQQSPMFGKQSVGSDPLLAFNFDGDLYAAGIAFNEAKPQDSVVYVTTWAGRPAGGLPYDYQRTAIVGKGGTPSTAAGQFTDKPMMEVDRTATQYNGNVYVCWSRFVGGGRTQIFFSRSTDGGTTFSNDISLSSRKDVQGCDIAIEADGDVYVVWGTRDTPSERTARAWDSRGPPTVAARSRSPPRSVPSAATSRSTRELATAATVPTSARATSCSRASRSSPA